MILTISDFLNDSTGKKLAEVTRDQRIAFDIVTDFLSVRERQQRMMDSEIHHDRAALAGVILELEAVAAVDGFFRGHDSHETRRFRQAVGVAVRIVMEGLGWAKDNRDGSLGRRVKVVPGTTTPGAYYNESGLSHWFTQAQRYAPPEGHPHYGVWLERKKLVEERSQKRKSA